MAEERLLLKISDAPMFERVMRNERVCMGVIEAILGVNVEKIEYRNEEHFLVPRLGGRGVRLDAYVSEGDRVFDVEMQNYQRGHLGMRMRYYQSVIDTTSLEPGDDYDGLPESYIIFICTDDPFGKGVPRYDIERTCKNVVGVDIDCRAHWVVLNANAYRKEGDKNLADLLNYIEDGTLGESPLVRCMDEELSRANEDSKWVRQAMSIMTIEEDAAMQVRIAKRQAAREVKEAREAAHREVEAATAKIRKEAEAAKAEAREAARREVEAAKAEAREETRREVEAAKEKTLKESKRYGRLMASLVAEERFDDIKRIAEDPELAEDLYAHYGL